MKALVIFVIWVESALLARHKEGKQEGMDALSTQITQIHECLRIKSKNFEKFCSKNILKIFIISEIMRSLHFWQPKVLGRSYYRITQLYFPKRQNLTEQHIRSGSSSHTCTRICYDPENINCPRKPHCQYTHSDCARNPDQS